MQERQKEGGRIFVTTPSGGELQEGKKKKIYRIQGTTKYGKNVQSAAWFGQDDWK